MAGLVDIVYPAGLRTWQTLPRRCSSVVSLGIEKGCYAFQAQTGMVFLGLN